MDWWAYGVLLYEMLAGQVSHVHIVLKLCSYWFYISFYWSISVSYVVKGDVRFGSGHQGAIQNQLAVGILSFQWKVLPQGISRILA